MPEFHLAQLNIATMKAPLDSPSMAEFVANIDRINRLAEDSPGYVWRLESEEGNAVTIRPLGDEILVNLSVWQDVEALKQFAFKTDHAAIMRRRREWFDRMVEAYVVLWWIPAGHRPVVEEAMARLNYLRRQGATPYAFSFRQLFPAPAATVEATREIVV